LQQAFEAGSSDLAPGLGEDGLGRAWPGSEQIENAFLWRAAKQPFERGEGGGVFAPVAAAVDGHDDPTGHRVVGCADNAVVARDSGERVLEDELSPALFTGQEYITVEEAEASFGLGGC